ATARPGKASQATSKTSWPNVAGRFRLGEKPTAMVRNHTATAPTAQTMTFSAELLGPRIGATHTAGGARGTTGGRLTPPRLVPGAGAPRPSPAARAGAGDNRPPLLPESGRPGGSPPPPRALPRPAAPPPPSAAAPRPGPA